MTFQSVLGIYLPKIAYVRWGEKGDPLFLKLGSFNDATLGDGFIMGDYNNMLFLPTERHFGFQADMDGALFNFPYVGVETVVGNLAQLDVLGARVYVRPLARTPIPILNALQIGVTAAVDTNPYYNTGLTGRASPWACSASAPLAPLIYTKDVFSLLAFTDAATIQGKTWGSMVGVGGQDHQHLHLRCAAATPRAAVSPPRTSGPPTTCMRGVQYNAIQTIERRPASPSAAW